MFALSVGAVSKHSLAPPSRRPLAPCRAVATPVTDLKEAKDKLRAQIKGLSFELYTVPEDVQQELQGTIEELERRNPTHEPRNVPDKFAGCYLMMYTSRTIIPANRSVAAPAKLSRVYYTFEPEGQELTKSLEFTLDPDHAGERLPGCLNMTSTFQWESTSKVKLTGKGVSVTSDELAEALQGKQEALAATYKFRGSFDMTFADDGLLVGRDDEGSVYVLEHRTTRVHA